MESCFGEPVFSCFGSNIPSQFVFSEKLVIDLVFLNYLTLR